MHTSTTTEIVRVEGVTKAYGLTRALDNVTLRLTGGITGLLGPNGAGKTSLLRILATLLPPDAGRIELFGLSPTNTANRVAVRRRLGYMPQEPGFHRNFTAFEFLDYIAILKELVGRHGRHNEVRRVLDLVGLAEKADTKIKSLSGGMRRRVALAQALLGEPKLLVLDEPTAGLDPEQRLQFRDVVSRAGDDCAVLLSTHQTEDVAHVCSDVAVLHEGRLLFRGVPSELTAQANGSVWLSDERDGGAQLAWRTGQGRHRHIGTPPSDAQLIPPTIEDGYLRLIGHRPDDASKAAR